MEYMGNKEYWDNKFAKRNDYLVNTKQVDLSISNSLNNIGRFDNILINHYRLSKEQLEEMNNHITDNGILFVCGFGYKHEIDSKIIYIISEVNNG